MPALTFPSDAGTIVGVTCAILVLLFAGQRFGTSKVGFTFAPIVLLWFVANVMVNLYNIIVYYPGDLSFSHRYLLPSSSREIASIACSE